MEYDNRKSWKHTKTSNMLGEVSLNYKPQKLTMMSFWCNLGIKPKPLSNIFQNNLHTMSPVSNFRIWVCVCLSHFLPVCILKLQICDKMLIAIFNQLMQSHRQQPLFTSNFFKMWKEGVYLVSMAMVWVHEGKCVYDEQEVLHRM